MLTEKLVHTTEDNTEDNSKQPPRQVTVSTVFVIGCLIVLAINFAAFYLCYYVRTH